MAAGGVLSDEQERQLAQANLHQRGLTLSLAQRLRETIDGRIDATWQRSANAGQLLSQASLLKLGFAEWREGQLAPTADVLYGLEMAREDLAAAEEVVGLAGETSGAEDSETA